MINGKASSVAELHHHEEPLSPAARLFHSPHFNCYIIVVIGSKTSIDPSVIKQGLEHTLIKHPRFSSKLEIDEKKGGKMKWIPTTVNIENHVIVPKVDSQIENPEKFIEDYISYMTLEPLDPLKPLWELHLLNVKTSEAEAVGVFRIHHSIGDGVSLVSLLLACTRKTSDPEALPSVTVQKRAALGAPDGWLWWLILSVWTGIMLVWNTVVDLILFSATALFLKDTKNPLKGGAGVGHVTKRFVHKTVSLDDIKLVKNAMNMTVNDVILGVTQAGLSRYLYRIYSKNAQNGEHKSICNVPKGIRIRAAVLFNLRPTPGIQALADMMAKESKGRWGNGIGYILLPFDISAKNDPLDYLYKAKATVARKKLSLEAFCTFSSSKLVLRIFGVKAAAAIAVKVLSNTTMAFSNVVGPLEEISFCGYPMAFLAPSVYGHPQALTIHFQSYVNKMTIVLAVDPNVIPDPHQLCDDIDESLKIVKNAVVERGLTSDSV